MRLSKEKSPELEKLREKAEIALTVCKRKAKVLDDIIDDKVNAS